MPFESALATGDLNAIRRCPKSDLHNHAVLGGDRAFLLQRTGGDIAPLDHKLHSMDEMHAWVGANIGPWLKGGKGRLLAYEAALVQARNDGVTRLEFGDDVWAIAQGNVTAAELTRSLEHLCSVVAPQIEWIPQVAMSRHCPVDALARWLAPFLELGTYRTLDLAGDELAQPIESFRRLYRMAKDEGLRLKAHVGEWGSADDVWRAVEELELDEVQHGIAAASSPAVMRMLADRRVRTSVRPRTSCLGASTASKRIRSANSMTQASR